MYACLVRDLYRTELELVNDLDHIDSNKPFYLIEQCQLQRKATTFTYFWKRKASTPSRLIVKLVGQLKHQTSLNLQ